MKLKRFLLVAMLSVSMMLTACGSDKESGKDTDKKTESTDKGDSKEDDKDVPDSDPEEVVEEDDGMDLTDEQAIEILENAYKDVIAGNLDSLKAALPYFITDEYLEDDWYTDEPSEYVSNIEIEDYILHVYEGEEAVGSIYDVNEIGISKVTPDRDEFVEKIKAIAVIQYHYNATLTSGEEKLGCPDYTSEFTMFYEDGEWKYFFAEGLPAYIINKEYSDNFDEIFAGSYVATSVNYYKDKENVTDSFEDFAAYVGIDSTPWQLVIEPQYEEFVQSYLMGATITSASESVYDIFTYSLSVSSGSFEELSSYEYGDRMVGDELKVDGLEIKFGEHKFNMKDSTFTLKVKGEAFSEYYITFERQ